MRMKAEGIHTIVETSGCGKKEDLLALADYTDTFYYDFKLADPAMFEKYTGGNLNTVRGKSGGAERKNGQDCTAYSVDSLHNRHHGKYKRSL